MILIFTLYLNFYSDLIYHVGFERYFNFTEPLLQNFIKV